mmetsp:Transcript_18555/g.33523  ORF Transcript_18555/g.33523 Transcript_18555/m.33523 type:complete len:283 (+) Transcript_18555:1025-1873(+)
MRRALTPTYARTKAPSPELSKDFNGSKQIQLSSLDIQDWLSDAPDVNMSLEKRLLMLEQRFEINPLDSTSQQTLSSKFKIDVQPYSSMPEACHTSKARYVPLSPGMRPLTPSSSRPQTCRASIHMEDVSTGEISWLEHGKQFNLLQSRMQLQTQNSKRKTVSCAPVQFHKMRKLLIPSCEFTSTAVPSKPVKVTAKPSTLPFEDEIRDFQSAIVSLRRGLKRKRQSTGTHLYDKENFKPPRVSLEQAFLKLVSEIEAVSQKIDTVRMENVWLEHELANLRCN